MSTSNIDKWRESIRLSDADWHFAPRRLRNELIAFDNRQTIANSKLISSDLSQEQAFANALQAIHKGFEALRDRWEIRTEMRTQLLSKIADGELHAYGFFVENGTASDEVVEIPPFLFDMKFVSWHDSSVKGLGRQYVSVRVEPKARTSPGATASARAIPARKPAGRPTKKGLIDDAIGALYRDGVNLAECTSKQRGELVRKRIAQQAGPAGDASMKGLTDETIRRAHAKWKGHAG